MDKNAIINKLNTNSVVEYLQKHQIKHIWLWWSYIDNTHNDDSDIDIIYEYDDSSKLFERWPVDAMIFLEKLFHKKVDLLDKDYIHHLIKSNIYDKMQKIW